MLPDAFQMQTIQKNATAPEINSSDNINNSTEFLINKDDIQNKTKNTTNETAENQRPVPVSGSSTTILNSENQGVYFVFCN